VRRHELEPLRDLAAGAAEAFYEAEAAWRAGRACAEEVEAAAEEWAAAEAALGATLRAPHFPP
jgi:hypothetical protein